MKRIALFILVTYTGFCANAHTINWYADGTVLQTTTCELGDNVTAPTLPETPYGYHSGKWAYIDDTKSCQFYYARLGVNELYKNWYLTKEIHNDVGLWKMKIIYPDYTVYGESRCSNNKTSDEYETGTPSSSNGQYCWCHATSVYAAGSSYSVVNAQWVYVYNYGDNSNCKKYCTNYCARGACYNDAPPIRKQFLNFTIGVVNE